MTEVMTNWQSRFQADWKPVEQLDFTWIKKKLMDFEEGEGWDEEFTNRVVFEYCKFLLLTKIHPECPVVPSKIVDKAWHYHILDTQAYVVDCDKVFGKFLHHFPYWGMRGDDDAKDLQDSFAKTLELYEEAFGPVPDELWKAAGRCPNCGSGSCFAPGTMIKMADGTERPIESLRLNEETTGGMVTGIMQYQAPKGELFMYNGAVVTGNHAVWEDQEWKRVRHTRLAIPYEGTEVNAVYCVRTSKHQLHVGSTLFADEMEVDGQAVQATHLISLAELNKQAKRGVAPGVC